ncbi:MAG: MFS transporter [Bacteroidetes bacterium]|nr:MFS transporter [Bacteroidota bacterium]MBU1680091.1 MFS transporter [Bacteroidota bacterium]MBU2507894.1 MFS transporter [Bacteroidota bacterium]
MEKPKLSFWQIWNMSFGFLGIQFGWGLQMANMSAIYEYLGADAHQIPMLWLAAPLTGLIVQPIVGNMSDRTWGRLGRRRPFFLVGAILSSIALIIMPNSSTLWMAAGLLWILDASINISMEPFRAFVADLLPEEQRTKGFAMQSLFIGLGAVIASALPWVFTNIFNYSNDAAPGTIPFTVKISFYFGAAAFMVAVLWTIFTTREYPPDDITKFQSEKKSSAGILTQAKEIFHSIKEMPVTMKQLAWVQVFTWLGLFCMWLYFGVAVARDILGAKDPNSPQYLEGIEWGGICFAMYSAVTFLFSFAISPIAGKLGRKWTHSLALICGGVGLMSVALISNKYYLLLSMTGVGIAWASILSMPYAMLAGALPQKKIGVYMGIFNFFIVLPEIGAALGFGWIMENFLDNNRMIAVVAGGFFMIIAAVLVYFVKETESKKVAT